MFGLWQKHLDAMSEDYRRNCPSPTAVEQMVLIDLRNMLQSMGKDIKSFPLPNIDDTYDTASGIPHEIFEESSIVPSADDVALSESLNDEQRAAYDEIIVGVPCTQYNMDSASAQNHRCSTSPWSIPGYRIFR